MPVRDRDEMKVGEPAAALAAVRALLDRWGLAIGQAVAGWRVESIELDKAVLVASFSRGAASVLIRFRLAGSEPRFDRVGAIDVSHGKVDETLGAAVATLLRQLVAIVRRHQLGAELVPFLSLPAGPRARAGEQRLDPVDRVDDDRQPSAAQPYVVVHEAPPLDPAKRAPPERPVVGFDFVDVADLPKYPNALREIFEGKRGGLVIRGVYSKEEMKQVVARLEPGQAAFPQMKLPPNQASYFLGLCLEVGDPTLSDYLAAAGRFRKESLSVFDGMEPFEARVERLFRALAGGRRVQLAEYTDGRAYTPATIRILPPGGQLAPHCGNEMYRRPSYEHLNSIVDNHDQLSYFLTLQEAEEGGGLVIYSLQWSSVGPDHILPDERSNVGLLLADAEWMEVRPSAGDVLIFDGGRYLHRVDWVRGERTRWTMGGFLMFDRSGETVLYFA